jgi:hypothetical protein
MIIHALEIPEVPQELATWLERRLMSSELLEFVAELRGIADEEQAAFVALDSILGEHRAAVLSQGLAVLPVERLRQLLATPDLLPELQELIFAEGEDYWIALLNSAELEAAALAAWPKLHSAIAVEPPRSRRRTFLFSLATLATAAVLLLAFFLQPPPEPTIAWGWAKPGALDGEQDREEYLRNLARSADEWFRKTPRTKPELAQRIVEFRAGCQQLLAAQHRPLSAKDRTWLIERCEKWLATFEQSLADLEHNRRSLSEVQEDMNTTVRNLMRALNERADVAS